MRRRLAYRIVASILVGLIVTIAVAIAAAQTKTKPVGGGYARSESAEAAPNRIPIWDIEVRTNPLHRRLRYWRMQVSGMNVMIPIDDYERNRLELTALPPHLRPRSLDDLWIYALFGESGWPLPALGYMVDDHSQNGVPDHRPRHTLVVGTWPNNNPRVIPLRPLWIGLLVDTALYACIVFGFVESVRLAIRALRTRPGHCRRCRYDLRGLSGKCPECGAEP